MNLGLGCLWLFSVLGLGSSGNENDAASVILGRGVSLEKMSKRKMVMVLVEGGDDVDADTDACNHENANREDGDGDFDDDGDDGALVTFHICC